MYRKGTFPIQKGSNMYIKKAFKEGRRVDLQEIIGQIKEHGTLVRPPIRVRKVKKGIQFKGLKSQKSGKKSEFNPEQYAKKMERDKETWAGVSGAWKHLRKTYASRARKRGNSTTWLVSLTEWWLLWQAAGTVRMRDGATHTIFSRRGSKRGDARVWRISPEKPWTLENMVIIFNGEIVANGRKLAAAELAKKA